MAEVTSAKIKNVDQGISYSEFKDYRANSFDLDEVAHDDPPHHDLHSLPASFNI